ncbi:MAG: hypothetical protein ACKVW3_00265 [Phycisphaerales bacterium]
MPPVTPEPARDVKLLINKDGSLEIQDPNATGLLGISVDPDVDINNVAGRQYGWNIKKAESGPPKGTDGSLSEPRVAEFRDDLFTNPWRDADEPDVLVTTNDPDRHGHFNTLAPPPRELVKLDVGFWGYYFRDRKTIQRDFGLVEGHMVMLCSFDPTGPSESSDTADFLTDNGRIKAKRLYDILAQRGLTFHVNRYAFTRWSAASAGLGRGLTAIFSDLHLPERFGPIPREQDRYQDPEGDRDAAEKVREDLRKDLVKSQLASGLLFGNFMSADYRDKIQAHIAAIEAGGSPVWNHDTGILFFKSIHPFTRDQFIAEKDLADRITAIDSNWFYPRGIFPSTSDPVPAIDLLNLLGALKAVQDEVGPGEHGVSVCQVGDLYEMWMNREFLYTTFPVLVEDAIFEPLLFAIRTPSSDLFQQRFDRVFLTDLQRQLRAKQTYVFHEWDIDDVERFHEAAHRFNHERLRSIVGEERCSRFASFLKQRVEAVWNFTLPEPVDPTTLPAKLQAKVRAIPGMWGSFRSLNILKQAHPELFESQYICGGAASPWINSEGHRELFWNKMIIDLFENLGTVRLWGNHDGYRGDPILSADLTGQHEIAKADGWWSRPGLWVEHSHRWDEYNRDGMAPGAGVTNLVYYHPKQMLDAEGCIGKFRVSQEFTAFQPGAFLWFLLVNNEKLTVTRGIQQSIIPLRDFLSEGDRPVHPFAVYVSGHTHGPDLIRMNIKLPGDS